MALSMDRAAASRGSNRRNFRAKVGLNEHTGLLKRDRSIQLRCRVSPVRHWKIADRTTVINKRHGCVYLELLAFEAVRDNQNVSLVSISSVGQLIGCVNNRLSQGVEYASGAPLPHLRHSA